MADVAAVTTATPDWLLELVELEKTPLEGDQVTLAGQAFVFEAGMLRSLAQTSPAQKQTEAIFAYKWLQRATFQRDAVVAAATDWCVNRYGPSEDLVALLPPTERKLLLLDAGCGAGHTGLNYLKPIKDCVHYLGSDISRAIDVALEDAAHAGFDAGFLQVDLMNLPLRPGCVDIVFSEGVLHHTDSTRDALLALANLLRPGGLFVCYVYRAKGPIREFTDDYIREKLQAMTPEEGWAAMLPLTKLGKALGELGAEITIEEPIPLLDIPAGPIEVQRLFYWHVMKAFYREDYTLEEMNHVNFDWYAPKNAHRQTPEQLRQWCEEAGLDLLREKDEDSGITVVARRR